MEPWKIAAIAVLGAGIIGYGVFANSSANSTLLNSNTVGDAKVAVPTPGATEVPSKYIGKTLPTWPAMKQWMNTPAPVDLSSLQGKPVFLEVFRIECSHCQGAAPFLTQLHQRFAPRGVQFVGIQSPGDLKDAENPESNWKIVQSWVKQHGYTWPVGFDEKSAWFQGKFGKGGNGLYYPTMFLLDKNGHLVFFQHGFDSEGQKALELGVELERIAPAEHDLRKRATGLAGFLSPQLGVAADQKSQDSLALEIAHRLQAPQK